MLLSVGVELQAKALSVYASRSLGLYSYNYISSCECCAVRVTNNHPAADAAGLSYVSVSANAVRV